MAEGITTAVPAIAKTIHHRRELGMGVTMATEGGQLALLPALREMVDLWKVALAPGVDTRPPVEGPGMGPGPIGMTTGGTLRLLRRMSQALLPGATIGLPPVQVCIWSICIFHTS